MKLYVLIDANLPLAYQGVQGGHAVAQWLLENPGQTWNNSTLVYLKANLSKEIYNLDLKRIDYTKFQEPDLNNQVTAIALQAHDKLFSGLKLIGV